MNRTDEIQGAARDIADWVCADPADRNRMADELIRLVTLVVAATGKGVAVAGESAMNGPDSEADAGGERYLVGEDLQRAAEEVREGSTGADIERYERGGLTPVWKADPAKRGAEQPVMELPDGCACVPVPVHHAAGSFLGFQKCKHQQAADKARARAREIASQLLLSQGLAGPFAPGELTRLAHETADAMREQHKTPVRCGECNRVLKFGHVFGCSHRIPAGATKDVPVPVVSHTWVLAMNEDGAPLDYIHCGVCGVRRCDRSCGDPSVGATPDIDCTTHGNDQARQCVERCRGCGDPVDNGRAHGPNQGFGGCC